MRLPLRVVVSALALLAASTFAVWSSTHGGDCSGVDPARDGGESLVPGGQPRPTPALAPGSASRRAPAAGGEAEAARHRGSEGEASATRGTAGVDPAPAQARRGWPTPRTAGGTRARRSEAGPAGGDPVVPERLAFRALWYLGVDAAAEATWQRAINDPNSPSGVRSDLIVDMTDEGYTDNERPMLADLPLIEARLSILERHAPYALDEGNRLAFAEAYHGLLAIWQRLAGRSREHEGR